MINVDGVQHAHTAICVTHMQVQVGALQMRADANRIGQDRGDQSCVSQNADMKLTVSAAVQNSRDSELSAETPPETKQPATSGLSQQSRQEGHCQDSEIGAKAPFHHQVASAEPFSRRLDATSGPVLPDCSALQPAASRRGRGRAPLGGPSARGHGRGRHRISLS